MIAVNENIKLINLYRVRDNNLVNIITEKIYDQINDNISNKTVTNISGVYWRVKQRINNAYLYNKIQEDALNIIKGSNENYI